jgi:hypothetical protein
VVSNQNAANIVNMIALIIVNVYLEKMGKSGTSAYNVSLVYVGILD